MKSELNSELIEAVKEKMLDDRNVLHILMETLSIGKEAAYRRIRGDVPFSFYEVVLIAKELGLSLDEIAGNSVTHGAMFSFNLQKEENPFDYIYGILKGYYNLYLYVRNTPTGKASNASSHLPFLYYLQYKTLTKFRVCSWLHQTHGIKSMPKMSSVTLPDNLSEITHQVSDMHRGVAHTTLLWDKNIFATLIEDIRFFYEMELVSGEEVRLMKEELNNLIDEIEEIAHKGKYANGNEVDIYISSINLEASYTYVSKEHFQLSAFHMFGIDYIHSENPGICEEQRIWIDSLKRYATLISQCGEKERLAFLKKQRESINSL
ncbi:hypothetical protein M2137_002899 [Parabacteroides sp. PFB2-10]|uniref:hypothetical protein n=1 Tax=Parabacteroides sp. PFB2-10 TaxID=1742405 RepID=UPI0024756996|nr:hypothetical protein [Parabacteroides sp. PFB2-10]MDH6314105.1 hypothetical protein [Parabacteroides sp. PFB2-10]